MQVCEPQEGQAESRMIEGTPIVFGVRSVNLTPWSETREVYEVLEPGCITDELLQLSDVILNLNHSNMVPDVLGRCRNGKGTLSLELRGDSIWCRCDLPRTNNANDTLELMRRGDITGMSFAFEDEETVCSVRLATDAEYGGFRECLAAEVHGRSDLSVRMHAYLGSCILAGQSACSGAAVPEGESILFFIEAYRVAEEYRRGRELHAGPHRKGSV